MKIALALIGAVGALAAAAPAFAVDNSGPCFLIRDVRNHTVGDDHTMYFDVDGRAVYRATMNNSCLAGATSSDTIVLRDRVGTGRICHKMDVDLSVAQGAHCIVGSLTKLTPEEVTALPRKVKP